MWQQSQKQVTNKGAPILLLTKVPARVPPNPQSLTDKPRPSRGLLLCIQPQGSAWLGPNWAHLHCPLGEGECQVGLASADRGPGRDFLVEWGQQAGWASPVTTVMAGARPQTRVSKAQLMLGPWVGGSTSLESGNPASLPTEPPTPVCPTAPRGTGGGLWAERRRKRNRRIRWVGEIRPSTAGRSHTGPETHL